MGRRPEQTFFQRKHTDGQQAHEKMFNTTNYQGNANQNHNEITPSCLLEWLLSKREAITSVGEDVEKREPLYTLGRNETGAATMENSMEIPQKVKNTTII